MQEGPISESKLAADIICKDPELAFNTMERMTRNIRTFCPDHEGVRLGMMLCLVGHMLPAADIWGEYMPKHLPSYVPASYKTALDAQFRRVIDPRGTHQFLYVANFDGYWQQHQELLHDYRCLLFANGEFSDEPALLLEDDVSCWMCQDRKILWQEFEQELVLQHRKCAKEV